MNTGATTAVAVIGMACRLPGGIDSPERLWEALLRGDDLVTEVPRERWDADEFYDAQPGMPGRTTSRWGAFLDDVAGFDADFFGIEDRAAAALDPQHRLLLETSWEAVEHAGLEPRSLTDSRTGVFVGLTDADYQLINAASDAMAGPYGFEGNAPGMASGRIARTLGSHGPALTLDTACASGLTAVHTGCRSLHEGESDLALAGSAFVMLEPRKFVAGSAQSRLSPTGRCHAFDAAADGYVTGEAVVVVLLKRLEDAQRDGDRILSVVRGTAANQDGRTADFSMPSAAAQTALYRAALEAAGVEAHTITMVEAHGTGAPAGDPIEYAGLSEVYGVQSPCALGSAKTNFGHTQSASGLLGLMKATLALQHGAIPPNLHFTRLPDAMARISTKLFVPQGITEWPCDGGHPRRAAVSAFGHSGTNVHVILEQAPDRAAATTGGDVTAADPATEATLSFPLSSTSAQELRHTAGRLAAWVDAHDEVALPDLAFTLARRRGHRPVRTTVVASSRPELTGALRTIADGNADYGTAVGQDDRGPVWVFSGAGSQWAGMGTDLLANEPVFAAMVARVEPLVARESGFSVTEAMTAAEVVGGIDRVQPTLFTMQVAMAAALRAHGAHPGAVIGHSMGETAAAVVAGALSLDDGVRIICRSSRLMSTIAGPGAMATVDLPAKQVLSELTMRSIKDVVIAVVASPQSTVIAGAAQTVHDLVAAWEQRDVTVCAVEVDVASNSPQVDPILDELAGQLVEINPLTPDVPFYSATGFDPREQPSCDGRYWARSLRSTVRFAAAVRAAVEDGYRIFAELAPDPLLGNAVEKTVDNVDVPHATLAAMHRGETMPIGLRGFVAQLHSAGAAIDFAVPHGQLVDAPLPTWTHRQLWLSKDVDDARTPGRCTISVHPLLGPHVRLQEEPERHVWRADLGTSAHPWLAEHRIHETASLPGAVWCEMALEAARVALGEPCEARDIHFVEAWPLGDQVTVGASTSSVAPGVADFTAEPNSVNTQTSPTTATLCVAEDDPPASFDIAALLAAHPHRGEGAEVRSRRNCSGIEYGPAFSGLGILHVGDDATGSVLAEVALPGQLRAQQGAYGIHPALLDACFQSVAASPHVQALGDDVLGLPSGVQRLRAYGSARNAHYCYTRVTKVDASGVEADLDLLDRDGVVLLSVQGLWCGTAVSEATSRDRVLGQRLLAVEWRQRPEPRPAHDDAGTWLLVSTAGGEDAIAGPVTQSLIRHGAHCTTMSWPLDADHSAKADELERQLRERQFTGLVILTAPPTDDSSSHCPSHARDFAQHLVRIARDVPEIPGRLPRLVVVTRNAQAVLPGDIVNLEQGALRGLVRVIGAEHPHLHTTQIDADDTVDAEQLSLQLLSGSEEDETAWRNRAWYTARLLPAPLRHEDRHTVVADHERDGMRLHLRTPGDLETLELIACERVAPGPGQIEVAVATSSINFADVLAAMGLLPTADAVMPELGMDFAGVVTAVGPDVTEHRIGDRVGGFSANGCWGTFVTCDAQLAVTLPSELTDHQAVAVATATVTAWYGLHDQARIGAGDRVLIHSATGGVGQAAIAVARAAGAEIFATAGSDERRDMLRRMGIRYVYDSRSTEFAEQIRRDTGGYGVDIVLNSLTGPAQRAGIELLATGGRFIEIGKRDVYGNTRLGLFPFRRNLTFCYVDLALMSLSHPRRVGELLRTVYRLVTDGDLPPARHTDYPLADAATAIRVMAAAQHTGKVLLDIPRTGRSTVVTPPEQAQVFRPDGAYLITGGLGDLGLFLAEKMAAAGCGRIVLTSRSQPTLKALETIELIRVMGGDVVVHCGDIADPSTAHRLVATATATGLPVRGVLHAAATVGDATLAAITDEDIERDWAPKVYGAWNLHTATADQPLDWFCSFSSAAALVGSPGRGAYAAANSWLDAFTRWRRAQGRPASAIAWGAWGQIGRATEPADGTGAAITPDEGAYAFEALLRHDRAYSGYAPITGTTWLTTFAHRAPFAEAFRSDRESHTGTVKLRAVLDDVPREEWPGRLRRMIADQISLVLRRSIDPDRPLAEYGVDSLGALELRTRIEAETGIRLASSDLAVGTVRGLAELLCEKLAPRRNADTDASA